MRSFQRRRTTTATAARLTGERTLPLFHPSCRSSPPPPPNPAFPPGTSAPGAQGTLRTEPAFVSPRCPPAARGPGPASPTGFADRGGERWPRPAEQPTDRHRRRAATCGSAAPGPGGGGGRPPASRPPLRNAGGPPPPRSRCRCPHLPGAAPGAAPPASIAAAG